MIPESPCLPKGAVNRAAGGRANGNPSGRNEMNFRNYLVVSSPATFFRISSTIFE